MERHFRNNDNSHGMYMNQTLVNAIQECEAVCEHMTHHLKMMGENYSTRTTQAILLRDCADICGLTAKYVARDSYFAVDTASMCAQICEACGDECSKFPDNMSQNCAQVCYNCAKHCNDFVLNKSYH